MLNNWEDEDERLEIIGNIYENPDLLAVSTAPPLPHRRPTKALEKLATERVNVSEYIRRAIDEYLRKQKSA